MNRRLMMLALAAPLLIAGCATTLTAENKATIRKVAVARQIEMPARPMVLGNGAGAAFLLAGPVGIMAQQSLSDLPSQFVQALSAQQVSVPELVRLALEEQLKTKGIEVVDREDQADAVLKTTITAYGLTGNILRSEDKRFPLLSTKFELVRRKSDEVVWRKLVATNVTVAIIEKLEQRPLADYFKDGDLLRQEHQKVTALVAAHAFRDF